MDIKQQLQRLLDLTEETRARAAELAETRAGAESHLDKAEYDLKQLVAELSDILPGLEYRPLVQQADAAETANDSNPSTKRRFA